MKVIFHLKLYRKGTENIHSFTTQDQLFSFRFKQKITKGTNRKKMRITKEMQFN